MPQIIGTQRVDGQKPVYFGLFDYLFDYLFGYLVII